MKNSRDGSDGKGEVALTARERKEVHSTVLLEQLDIFDVLGWSKKLHFWTKADTSGVAEHCFECVSATCLCISQSLSLRTAQTIGGPLED